MVSGEGKKINYLTNLSYFELCFGFPVSNELWTNLTNELVGQ